MRLAAVIASALMVLGVATQSATAEQLTPGRLPFGSVVHLFRSWFDEAAAAVLPGESAGHSVGAHSTKAGKGSGRAPGLGEGQLPAAGKGAPTGGKAGASGKIAHGYDSRTSVLDQSRTNANQTWYKNADGSLTERISQLPVNYQDAAGDWHAIDPSLVKTDGGFTHKAAGFGLAISSSSAGVSAAKAQSVSGAMQNDASADPTPSASASASSTASASPTMSASPSASSSIGSSSTDDLVALSLGSGESIGWSLAGASSVPAAASGDSVSFNGILPDTNLVLTSEPYGVQEDFQLQSASAPNTFVLPLQLTGVSLHQDADSAQWTLVDSSGNTVAVLPVPWAADANELSTGSADDYTEAAAYGLTTVNGQEALTITVPQTWLDDPARAFPVTVDPTLELAGAGGAWSKYVNSACTVSCSDNSDGYLQVGYSVSGIAAESFLDFPASNLVGTGYHVSSAQFAAFMAFDANTADEAYYINPIQSSWSASGTEKWPSGGIAAAGTNVPSLYAEFGEWTGDDAAASCTIEGTSTSGKWTYVNMTSASSLNVFNSWSTKGLPYYGIGVTGYSYTNTGYWKQLASSLNGGCSPYVYITYTPDAPAVTNVVSPVSGTTLDTLTPTLTVSSSDSTSWSGVSREYEFAIYKVTGTSSTPVITSSPSTADTYTIPAGKLAWGNTYEWDAATFNGWQWGSPSAVTTFSTTAPPPILTGNLSQNSDGHGFNASIGDYTTSATDASVAGAGPSLAVERDYNSLDARTGDALGQGWSSVLDAKVTQVLDAKGSVSEAVVTYPDGQQVAFGLNADGSYSPPEGRYATLTYTSGSGYSLVDKSGTTYSFTHAIVAAASGTAGQYGLAYVSDNEQRKLNFTWSATTGGQVTSIASGVSGRSLAITWSKPQGAASAHVTNITTNDAVANEAWTAQAWTYAYSGDELTQVCAPQAQVPTSGAAVSSSKCTGYTYQNGTVYQLAVQDSAATQYWPLDEASGSSTGSTLITANIGSGTITYNNVALGGGSHLASSTATTATFNGTSSSVELPDLLLSQSSDESVAVWFKTTGTSQILVDAGGAPLTSASSAGYDPALYIGKDGKLVSELWTGDANTPMESTAAVNDGNWHFAVLSGSGVTGSQSLYVDGNKVASKSGTITLGALRYVTAGAGWMGDSWPDNVLTGAASAIQYFRGSMSDLAYYNRALTGSDVKGLYQAGTASSAALTSITRPNLADNSAEAPSAQVAYSSVTGRVTSVTDANGAQWQVGAPSAYGSSYVYRAAVDAFSPQHVWSLDDAVGSTQVSDNINGDAWYGSNAGLAQYNSVTLGLAGSSEMSSWSGATFNGSSSYIELPDSALNAKQNTTTPSLSASVSVGLWFKTTGTSQVLVASGGAPVTASASAGFDPVLYVGKDGKLVGELWTGDASTPMESSDAVNDGGWHFALIVGNDNSTTPKQYLYVDGKEVASKSGAMTMSNAYVTLGAGWMGETWPDDSLTGSGSAVQRFSGSMADVAIYRSALTEQDVAELWQAYRNSSGNYDPIDRVIVTDPADSFSGASHTEQYFYDPQNGLRLVEQVSALGEMTTYGYDTSGFLDTTVDANGDETITGHDARGNEVSQTTCQLLSQNKCSTSYKSYYWSANKLASTSLDVRADLPVTSSDARSASATDTTYQTTYTYDAKGAELTSTDPLGHVTLNAYTDGTTAFPACDAASKGAPAGLTASQTSPSGETTSYTYYADGDTCTITNGDGLVTHFTYDGLGRQLSKTVGHQVVGAWPLTDAAGSTSAVDHSGLGATGAATDVTFNGSAATFPGTAGQGIVAPDSVINTAASYTISAWVYPQKAAAYQPVVNICGVNHCALYLEENASGQWEYAAQDSDDLSTATGAKVATSAAVTLNAWSLVTGVFDASAHTLTMYINGTSIGTSNWAAPWVGTSPLTIGAGRYAGSTSSTGTFTGQITNVQAYQRALSAAEVTSLYGEGSSGAVLPYPTNENLTTSYVYDGQDRVTQTTSPAVTDQVTGDTHTPVSTVAYDADGNVISSTISDATGGDTARQSISTYNNYDQLLTKQDPDQHTTSYTYDLFGNVETTTDPLDRTTKTLYDADNLKRAQYLMGTAEDGSPSSTDLLQEAWTYDAGGRLATDVLDPNKLDYTTTYSYYDNNLAYQVTKTDGTNSFVESTSTYDGAGNVVTQATNNGVTQTDYAYDDAGEKTSVTVDPSGADRVTTYSYTPDGKVSETKVAGVIDAGGDRGTVSDQSVTYDNTGNVLTSTVVNALNRYTTTNQLDEYGQTTAVTDPLGHTTYYTYDQAGRKVQQTTPSVTSTTYSTATGKAATADAVAVSTIGYDTFGDEVESRDPDGNESCYVYGADGELAAKIMPSSAGPCSTGTSTVESTYKYDDDSELQTVTDPNAFVSSNTLGETTTYNYDQFGKATSEQVADHVTGSTYTASAAYDALGRTVSSTDPNGGQTGTTYNYLDQPLVTSVIDRFGGANDATSETDEIQNTYGAGGWLTEKQSESTGAYTKYGYDDLGEQTAATDAAGDTTSSIYDGAGRVVKTTAPDGTYSTTSYDEAGRNTATGEFTASGTQVGGGTTGYDADGETTSSTVIQSSSVSPTTTYSYDATGLLVAETQPVDSNSADSVTVTFGYDPAGNQTAYTDGNGNQAYPNSGNLTPDTAYTTYTTWGQVQSQVKPATSTYTSASDLTTTNAYDADGDLQTQTLPGQVQLDYSYDGRGDLLSETGIGAQAATATRTFQYDSDGRVTNASTSNTLGVSGGSTPTATATGATNATSEAFSYNDRGSLIKATGSAGTSSFTYNPDGQMAARTDASGTTSYTYDTSGRLWTVSDGATSTNLTYSYNADSEVSQISYGSGSNSESFGYNPVGQLTSDALKTSSGSVIQALAYGYDEAGDLTSKTDSSGTANSYTYDEAGRLTSWTKASTAAYSGTGTCTSGSTLTCYSYDQDSNRTQSGSNVYTYNSQDELTGDGINSYTYTAMGTLSSEATSSANGTNTVDYQDDAYGQQTSAGVELYGYDASGRLITQQNSGGGTATTLAYSGTGNEVASDGTTEYSRNANGSLLGETSASGSALIWTDQHTDVVGTFTAAGSSLTGTETYDPFGKVIANTGTTAALSVGYQSEWTDASNGQVNMAARWYNPANGEFTSKDSASNSAVPNTAAANPFAYGDASPLDGTDPSGHMFSVSYNGRVASGSIQAVNSEIETFAFNDAVLKYDPKITNVELGRVDNAFQKARHDAVKVADAKAAPAKVGLSHMIVGPNGGIGTLSALSVQDAEGQLGQDEGAIDDLITQFAQADNKTDQTCNGNPLTWGGCVHNAEVWVNNHPIVKDIVSAAAGIVVGGACMAASLGIGSVGCMALGGAAMAGASYAIGGDATGKGSIAGLAESTLIGGMTAYAAVTTGGAVSAAASTLLGDSAAATVAASTVSGFASGFAGGTFSGAGSYLMDCGSSCSLGGMASAALKSGVESGVTGAALSAGASLLGSMPQCHSFTGNTGVLMADGSVKDIDQIEVGDKIANSVPGKLGTQANSVTKVITTYTDHDYVDLTVAPVAYGEASAEASTSGHAAANEVPATLALKSSASAKPATKSSVRAKLAVGLTAAAALVGVGQATSAAAVTTTTTAASTAASTAGATPGASDSTYGGSLTTTFHHPFYDETQHAFIEAQYLKTGDRLQTPTGAAIITGVRLYHADTTTYDLTIGALHTFYVEAGDTPVLVHNCDFGDRATEINNVLDDGTPAGKFLAKNGTTAVTRAVKPDGSMVDVVAANGDGLTDAQVASLRTDGEIPEIAAENDPDLHAELNAQQYINSQGWTKVAGGTNRNTCPYCENSIRDAGGRLTGPSLWRQRIQVMIGGVLKTRYPYGQRSYEYDQGE